MILMGTDGWTVVSENSRVVKLTRRRETSDTWPTYIEEEEYVILADTSPQPSSNYRRASDAPLNRYERRRDRSIKRREGARAYPRRHP